jgi:hypothetical protein
MSAKTDIETFLERAAQALAAAEETRLGNVRERCLRAAAAWTDMAERLQHVENARATHEAEKQRSLDSGQAMAPAWPANLESKKSKTNEHQSQQTERDQVNASLTRGLSREADERARTPSRPNDCL